MKRLILFTALLSVAFTSGFCQDERPVIRPVQYYIGLQPGMYVEPFDEFRNAFNFNMLPLAFEIAANRRLGFRIRTIADLQVRPEFPAELATLGTEFAAPFYFSKKNSEEGHRGFYAAPVGGFIMHRLNNYLSFIASAEIGYSFLFHNVLSVSLGAAVGYEFQLDPENTFVRIVPSTGGRICFGFWF